MDKKETEPLLDNTSIQSVKQSSSSGQQTQLQDVKSRETQSQPSATSLISKKGPKIRSGSGSSVAKPKLPSLHESWKEDDILNHGKSSGQKRQENVTCPKCLSEVEPTRESKGGMYFGIKSYLHQFYENASQQNTPGGVDEEDFHYLIRPKSRTLGAVLFKVGLITGATLFLLGAVAIIIGYAIPTQEEIRGQTDEFKIIDRNAMRFNRNLDMCKLIGLTMFCSGGLVLVISLLAPTFTSSYWEEDLAPEGFRVPLNLSPIPEDEPKSPIPVTEKIQSIQPMWTQ